jgi:hypothetical protein
MTAALAGKPVVGVGMQTEHAANLAMSGKTGIREDAALKEKIS